MSNESDCKYCCNITLETLSNGLLHAPDRNSLVRSAQKCRFCSVLFRRDRSGNGGQLFLKLEPFSVDDPQLCLRISHGHSESHGEKQIEPTFFVYTSLGTLLRVPLWMKENYIFGNHCYGISFKPASLRCYRRSGYGDWCEYQTATIEYGFS